MVILIYKLYLSPKMCRSVKDAEKILRNGLFGKFRSLQCYHFGDFEVSLTLPFSKIFSQPTFQIAISNIIKFVFLKLVIDLEIILTLFSIGILGSKGR